MHTTATPTHTPWGTPDYSREIATGLILFSTPGHGGFWLSLRREQARRDRFPEFVPFAGSPWYEEDCDAAVVVLCFPEHFDDQGVMGAVRSVRSMTGYKQHPQMHRPGNRITARSWDCVNEWLEGMTAEAASVRLRASDRQEAVSGLWERGSMWTATKGHYPRGTWGVQFRRGRDGACRTEYMDYPEERYYTDVDLDRLRVEPLRVSVG